MTRILMAALAAMALSTIAAAAQGKAPREGRRLPRPSTSTPPPRSAPSPAGRRRETGGPHRRLSPEERRLQEDRGPDERAGHRREELPQAEAAHHPSRRRRPRRNRWHRAWDSRVHADRCAGGGCRCQRFSLASWSRNSPPASNAHGCWAPRDISQTASRSRGWMRSRIGERGGAVCLRWLDVHRRRLSRWEW